MREYRVVRDGYAGFEAQVRTVYFGFICLRWKQIHSNGYSNNTSSTLERALAVIEAHKRKKQVVYHERSR